MVGLVDDIGYDDSQFKVHFGQGGSAWLAEDQLALCETRYFIVIREYNGGVPGVWVAFH